MQPLTVASFFSGIGLLDLGLEWAGWRTVSFSEIGPFASRVLATRFPGVPNLGDIHGIEHVPDATLWVGGFPCQPISNAGRRLGTDDDRWLWPAWARLIRQFRPRYLLLENVSALLGRGLGDVLGDLAACGYDAEWDCIPAAAVGAPHIRDRIWIVAYAARLPEGRATEEPRSQRERAGASSEPIPAVAYAYSRRREGERSSRLLDGLGAAFGNDADGRGGALAHAGRSRLPQPESPAVFGAGWRDEGRATSERGWWATEPDVGRVAHGVPARVDRLRSLGNAVVPHVPYWIGKRLREVIES